MQAPEFVPEFVPMAVRRQQQQQQQGQPPQPPQHQQQHQQQQHHHQMSGQHHLNGAQQQPPLNNVGGGKRVGGAGVGQTTMLAQAMPFVPRSTMISDAAPSQSSGSGSGRRMYVPVTSQLSSKSEMFIPQSIIQQQQQPLPPPPQQHQQPQPSPPPPNLVHPHQQQQHPHHPPPPPPPPQHQQPGSGGGRQRHDFSASLQQGQQPPMRMVGAARMVSGGPAGGGGGRPLSQHLQGPGLVGSQVAHPMVGSGGGGASGRAGVMGLGGGVLPTGRGVRAGSAAGMPLPMSRPDLEAWLGHFVTEDLMGELHERAKTSHQRLAADDAIFKQVPMSVGTGKDTYHSLVPLDKPFPQDQPSLMCGVPTMVFRASFRSNGRVHCITCIPPYQPPRASTATAAASGSDSGGPGSRLSSRQGLDGVAGLGGGLAGGGSSGGGSRLGMQLPDLAKTEGLSQVRHPAVVALERCFVCMFRDQPAFFAAHTYHANSETLEERYGLSQRFFKPKGPLLPEDVLWSYVVQLCSGLNAIHSAGLASKMVHASKVLVTGHNRVRLCGFGLAGAMGLYDPTKVQSLQQAQMDDVFNLGRLVLQLACQSSTELTNATAIAKGIETMSQHYSSQLRDFVALIVAPKQVVTFMSAREVYAAPVLAPHIARIAEASLWQTDLTESMLSEELENGRLARLMMRLGYINERPSHEMDPRDSWSETGDRYLLKLFRDYVFHQEDEMGSPIIDYGHTISCLNKLDAGSREKLMLVSRDEQSVVVTSYTELRRCLQESFDDLSSQQYDATSAAAAAAAVGLGPHAASAMPPGMGTADGLAAHVTAVVNPYAPRGGEGAGLGNTATDVHHHQAAVLAAEMHMSQMHAAAAAGGSGIAHIGSMPVQQGPMGMMHGPGSNTWM